MNSLTFVRHFGDYYTSTYAPVDTSSSPEDVGFAMIFFGIMFVMFVIAYVVFSLLLARIFKKAGVQAWKAWVPFYNTWIMLELGDQQGFWAVLALIPVVGFVSSIFLYIAMYNIGLKFKKDGVFVLWAIFLPVVWYAWLALDSSTWQGQKAEAPTAPATPAAPTPIPPTNIEQQ